MKTKLLIALCSLGIVLLTTCSSEEKINYLKILQKCQKMNSFLF